MTKLPIRPKIVVFCNGTVTSLGLIRALGRASYRPECIAYGKEAEVVTTSRYVSKCRTFKTPNEAVDFLMYEYPSLQERPILFTASDLAQYLVDHNLNVLQKKFITFSAGEQGMLKKWMDKQRISELAKEHGLEVPWMIRFRRGDEIPDNLDYPVFTKTCLSAFIAKYDEHICHSKKELKSILDNAYSKEILIMPFINKTKEVNYFGISIKGRVFLDYKGEDLRAPDGKYGYYYRFSPVREDDVLQEKIISMIKATGYEGMFDVEFLVDTNGTNHFTEVNFRVDGSIYQLSYGINLADWWYKLTQMTEETLPDSLGSFEKVFYGIDEIKDFKTSVLKGKVGVVRWLFQYLKAKRHNEYYLMDPVPNILRFCKKHGIRLQLCKKHT